MRRNFELIESSQTPNLGISKLIAYSILKIHNKLQDISLGSTTEYTNIEAKLKIINLNRNKRKFHSEHKLNKKILFRSFSILYTCILKWLFKRSVRAKDV